jgi:hypothetical protein
MPSRELVGGCIVGSYSNVSLAHHELPIVQVPVPRCCAWFRSSL